MIVFNTKELKNTLTTLKKFTTNKSLPILSGIKFEADKDSCKLTASNLEITFEKRIPCLGTTDSFVVGDLSNIIKSLGLFDSKTNFELENEKVVISSGKRKIQLNSFDVNDFPSPYGVDVDPIVLSKNELLKQFSKIEKSLSNDDARPALMNVCFKNNNLVATNGFEISSVPFDMGNMYFCVLPEIFKALACFDGEDNIQFLYKKDDDYYYHAVFYNDNNKIIFGNSEYNYPDTNAITPNANNLEEEYDANRIELIDALTFLSNFKSFAGYNAVVYNLDGSITKKDENENIISQETSIRSKNRISYNNIYMLDLLRNQFSEDIVRIKYFGKLRPIYIYDDNDENGFALLMPIHLEEK